MSNGHIQHPEEIFLGGDITSALKVLGEIQIFAENLVRHKFATTNQYPKVSVKWDGSPAVFVGRDSGFFVGTKRFLNKTKKIQYRTPDEIMNSDEYDDVKKKLITLFKEFKDMDITDGVAYQGDMLMFNGNHSFDPNGNVTVMGNVLRYSFPPSDKRNKRISNASAVVAWHTKYTKTNDRSWSSKALPEYLVEKLSKHPTVVCLHTSIPKEFHYKSSIFDVNHYDVLSVNGMIKSRLEYLQEVGVEETLKEISKYLVMFVNHLIKSNSFTESHFVYDLRKRFKYWFKQTIQSERDKGRIGSVKYNKYMEDSFLQPLMESTICVFDVIGLFFKYKRAILTAFNKVYDREVLVSIQDKDGVVIPFEHEGLVVECTNHKVKIVDRQKFSFVNFDPATARAFNLG